jgi:hypothetical protein
MPSYASRYAPICVTNNKLPPIANSLPSACGACIMRGLSDTTQVVCEACSVVGCQRMCHRIDDVPLQCSVYTVLLRVQITRACRKPLAV